MHETFALVKYLNRSESVILEKLLAQQRKQSPVLDHLVLSEPAVVGAWYIWWQRKKIVKGEGGFEPFKHILCYACDHE